MAITKPQLELIKRVLDTFNHNGIKYCILRNYNFLLGSSDPVESLDTTILKEDLPRVRELFSRLGFIERKQQFSLSHKAFFKLADDLNKVSFDVQVGGVHWNDMPYIDESILDNRINKSFFYVPSDNDTFVMLLVHSILGKRMFRKKYKEILLNLYSDSKIDEKYLFIKLSKIFNKRIAKSLLISVKENKFGEIPIKKLVAYFIGKKPSRTLNFVGLFYRWVIWKKPFKLAPLISIVGPDGSGKSTLVESLNEFLIENRRKTSVIYSGRGRGHILPISKLGVKYKSKEKKKDKIKEINVKKENNVEGIKKSSNNFKRRLLYTCAAPVFTLDLLLRYLFYILPLRMKKRIVLTDRYCSDIILMKNVPYGFKKVLLSLFPKPTASIFLYNSPEVLHQRRPEEPVSELARQMDIFDKQNFSLSIKTSNKEADRKRIKKYVLNKLTYNWF